MAWLGNNVSCFVQLWYIYTLLMKCYFLCIIMLDRGPFLFVFFGTRVAVWHWVDALASLLAHVNIFQRKDSWKSSLYSPRIQPMVWKSWPVFLADCKEKNIVFSSPPRGYIFTWVCVRVCCVCTMQRLFNILEGPRSPLKGLAPPPPRASKILFCLKMNESYHEISFPPHRNRSPWV
jgi:hypothetical protein